MSDARYDVYQHYGTNAERLLFVPDPPALTGVQPIYIWYETDTLTTWVYSTSWTQITGAGVGAPAADTYLTENDETATLPNSRQVLAGDGISFDDTVANVRTISSSTGIFKATVTLTDAQIKALPTSPFELVAAPGASKKLILLLADLVFDLAAGAYTNVDDASYANIDCNGSPASSWLTDNSGPSFSRLKDILSAVQVTNTRLFPFNTVDIVNGWGLLYVGQVEGPLINQPYNLVVSNAAAGDFTGGNAANSLVVNVLYMII